MKILLINPPYDSKDDTVINSFFLQPVQNMGLAYIASYLEQFHHNVDVMECPPLKLKWVDISKQMKNNEYDLVGISVYSYNFKMTTLIGNRIKKMFPKTKLVLGGFLATLFVNEMFNNILHLDYCVLHEGEQVLHELITALENEFTTLEHIKGIAFKNKDGKIIVTKKQQINQSLDELPFPKMSYLSPNGMAAIISGRGCHGQCHYCAVANYISHAEGKYCRKRKPELVTDEILHLIKSYGIKFLTFHDDSFFTSATKSWIEQWVESMRNSSVHIPFNLFARSDDVIFYQDQIPLMKEIGLTLIFIGVESFVPRQLKLYKKGISSEDNIRAVKILKENKVNYSLGLMLLDPFVNIDEIRHNLSVLVELEYVQQRFVDIPPVSLLSPVYSVKGSKFEEMLATNDFLNNTELGYDFQDPMVRLFYNIQEKWTNSVWPLNRSLEAYGIAYSQGDMDLAEHLLDAKIALRNTDILFTLALCDYVEMKTRESLTVFLRPWLSQLEIIQYTIDRTIKGCVV